MSSVDLPLNRLAGVPSALQWAGLVCLSLVFSLLLQLAGLPAALFLGPMIAGIFIGINGGIIHVPQMPYYAAQGFMGCVIATAITSEIVAAFLKEWPLFLGIVFAIIAASGLLGWQMTRWRVFPGTTSIWGSSPGAANAMVIMAEAFGADARLVAFMQYSRVVCVALVASLVARLSADPAVSAASQVIWFPTFHASAFAQTLIIALVGAALGKLSGFPSGAMVVPMIIGAILHATGYVMIELPRWVLAVTYVLLGWRIGLGFTRSILLHAVHALPKILLAISVLIAFSGLLALVLVCEMGITPLTAYLATSPGGLDAIAIIASGSHVDLPFVMALQTVRFFMIVLVGPPIARHLARRDANKQNIS